jgi:uroporphyrinogen decarboxylase
MSVQLTHRERLLQARRRIDDLAPGGGYVLASVHNMQSEVPPENICAMFEEAKEYGRYA